MKVEKLLKNVVSSTKQGALFGGVSSLVRLKHPKTILKAAGRCGVSNAAGAVAKNATAMLTDSKLAGRVAYVATLTAVNKKLKEIDFSKPKEETEE